MNEPTARRTKRRYAHELYPHADEWETRELATEVPYLYARAIGFDVWGTGWFDNPRRDGAERMNQLLDQRRIALLADALHQGKTGQEAWAWADTRMDESGEWIYQQAVHYGVDPDRIKPYECGPEPDHHDHHSAPDSRGWRTVTRVDGKESECEECTEPTA